LTSVVEAVFNRAGDGRLRLSDADLRYLPRFCDRVRVATVDKRYPEKHTAFGSPVQIIRKTNQADFDGLIPAFRHASPLSFRRTWSLPTNKVIRSA
jgi:hypothetical protein